LCDHLDSGHRCRTARSRRHVRREPGPADAGTGRSRRRQGL